MLENNYYWKMKVKFIIKGLGYVLFILSLLMIIFGINYFLKGPEEKILIANNEEKYEFSLNFGENRTIVLTPFKIRELCEYDSLNISDLLIDRTIKIQLITKNGYVSFSILNSTQYEFFNKEIEEENITYKPKNFWESYHLIVMNKKVKSTSVSLMISDTFVIKNLTILKHLIG